MDGKLSPKKEPYSSGGPASSSWCFAAPAAAASAPTLASIFTNSKRSSSNSSNRGPAAKKACAGTGSGFPMIAAAASMRKQRTMLNCSSTRTGHSKSAALPLFRFQQAIEKKAISLHRRLRAAGEDEAVAEGLQAQVNFLESHNSLPKTCDDCLGHAKGTNAEHNEARRLSGKLRADNDKLNGRWNAVNSQIWNPILNAKWAPIRAAESLQAGIEFNNSLRDAGFDIPAELTKQQVRDELNSNILQQPLILQMRAGTTSGYPGIGRWDGPNPNFPEDPFRDFIEPYKSMTRRGGYEPLLVHAGTHADITVGEAKGMVKWVELYRSFNRVNTERMETALHDALHEELPLGVRLNRSRGKGASAYKIVDGQVLLTPFILFLMVFKNEGLVSDNPGVVFNPPMQQKYGL